MGGRPVPEGERSERRMISMPAPLWERLRQEALRSGRSMSDIIRTAVVLYLESPRPDEAALAAAAEAAADRVVRELGERMGSLVALEVRRQLRQALARLDLGFLEGPHLELLAEVLYRLTRDEALVRKRLEDARGRYRAKRYRAEAEEVQGGEGRPGGGGQEAGPVGPSDPAGRA